MDALTRYNDLVEADRIIELDFPVRPEIRFGWDKPRHPALLEIIAKSDARYASRLQSFQQFAAHYHRIPAKADNPVDPSWINDFIPAADGISIYGYLALRNPRMFVEIGSGNSTKFARRAIRDHGLRTKIVSIDPFPRAECDELCDEIIREPLERTDLSLFRQLTHEDVVFCDNSHRSFQNSDVTVFFLDVLPQLPTDLLIGIHDIFLPHDYPAHWRKRYYNEQYLLACWLLAGAKLWIDLPMLHCIKSPDLNSCLAPIWSAPVFDQALRTGGGFWFWKQ